MIIRLPLTALLLATAVIASSCAVAPARLDRVHMLGQSHCEFHEVSLHALLEVALENPNQGRSAHALGHVVEEWKKLDQQTRAEAVRPSEDSRSKTPFRIRFRTSGPTRYSPDYFDTLSPAVDYRVRKIERFQKSGVGATLRSVRENRRVEPVESWYPPEAITREVTAVIHPRGIRKGIREVEIELICALHHESVFVNGKREPLAADYSVALASMLERTKNLKRSEVADLFTTSPSRDPQLYLMERYDPTKEPLIMIHGLLDSPLAWAELTNELRNVPEIRQRYQIWHYLYNTSAPALYSGRILRTQYRQLRSELDPNRRDRAFREATLLCHSMGGIVARSLITNPGDAFWDVAFTRPLSSLELNDTDRASLTEAFFWKPEPAVKRVIFIAVPHRGSHFADNHLGRIGRALVQPPSEFQAFYDRISSANPGAFTEAYADLGSGKLDSVSSLSPTQPTLQILPDLPLGYPVHLHSIIADRGIEGALEESSDGIVDYWSSHLEDVESEKIVPSGHSATGDPETIKEVKRILRLR